MCVQLYLEYNGAQLNIFPMLHTSSLVVPAVCGATIGDRSFPVVNTGNSLPHNGTPVTSPSCSTTD